VCFRNATPKTARNIIFLIISLVHYWTGGQKAHKKRMFDETQQWIPEASILDAIPLRVILPGEEESISYHQEDSSN
jgi:hypothetical protein